jgi:hypothetical protein
MQRPRVILLGASNLTRLLPTMLAMLPRVLSTPACDVLAAIGRGRSYGITSRFLGRSLGGIVECGLWDAIDARERGRPTFALITDIGNDIMYAQPLGAIADWVEACAERLQRVGSRIVITPPPMPSIERITPRQFRIVKGILFPRHDISFSEAVTRARLLTDLVRDIATRRRLHLVEHAREWYGFDPIHVRPRQFEAACAAMLAPWSDECDVRPSPGVAARAAAALALARPLRWWRFGRVFLTPQPAIRLPGGAMVSLF